MQETQETWVQFLLGRSPGKGKGNPHQHSCLENSVDRGAWWATVLGVTHSDMFKDIQFFKYTYNFIFGSAGSLLLRGLFSSCGKQGLLSSCRTWASHCCGFSGWGTWALGCPGFGRCGLLGSRAQA